MPTTFRATDRGFELACAEQPVLVCDDASFTAWGEPHRLSAGALSRGPAEETPSDDELGPHQRVEVPFVTHSARHPVRLRLVARCYAAEPVVLLELLPALSQPVFGTEECASLRIRELCGCEQGMVVHQRVSELGREALGSWFAQALKLADPCRFVGEWGLFAGWRTTDGRVGVLLTMRAGGAVSRLRGDGEGLNLIAAGWCGRHVYPRLPLGLVTIDESPGAALDRAFRAASRLCEWSFKPRVDKLPVAAFEGLGWTTWPGYGRRIDAERVVAAARRLRERGVPLSWLGLDEGWQNLDEAGRLLDAEADPERFPDGLRDTVRRLQGEGGVRHVGLWTTLQGAWGGLADGSPLAPDCDQAYTGLDGTLVPHPGDRGVSFWRQAMKSWRDAGIDFVRVDNQGSGRNLYLHTLPLDDGVGGSIASLERAAGELGLDLAAGMSLHPECLYHYSRTNTVRVAADVVPGDMQAAKRHLANAVQVGAWVSRIAWPDPDAIPTTGPAARAYAVVAALLGGPVAVAGLPDDLDLDLIGRLCLADGRLLLPEQPAEPPEALFFTDPLTAGPLVLAARAGRLPRWEPSTGLDAPRRRPAAWHVGLVNVDLADRPVTAELTARLLGLPPAERYAAAAHFSGRRWTVAGDEPFALELAPLEAEVVTIAPVADGRALLGLAGKLLGACGTELGSDGVAAVPEPGLVLLFDDTGTVPESVTGEPLGESDSESPEVGRYRRDGAWLTVWPAGCVFRVR